MTDFLLPVLLCEARWLHSTAAMWSRTVLATSSTSKTSDDLLPRMSWEARKPDSTAT
eukprot:CAMPEP_0177360476 /NCGR_PEP_ID=MMETSP0368-20130122/36675_1 /TAXON_ID=447022 ORGANISM="Scrippsiella hangoei-like, Strain SHHI-4" /NCGR_SAMPLE_ID=MMETSP0368 /ASSEMBLY_ACC=CAM_ASM_000363 /LENGTH=56 /DNA_ID=CAMNT_0018823069 /DNA_START=48 /DNA_END=215 /DNA_ORIENTATION=+